MKAFLTKGIVIMKQIIKDVLSDPHTGKYSFIGVWGSVGAIIGCTAVIMDTLQTGSFEIKDFFEYFAWYLLMVGTPDTVKFVTNILKKKD